MNGSEEPIIQASLATPTALIHTITPQQQANVVSGILCHDPLPEEKNPPRSGKETTQFEDEMNTSATPKDQTSATATAVTSSSSRTTADMRGFALGLLSPKILDCPRSLPREYTCYTSRPRRGHTHAQKTTSSLLKKKHKQQKNCKRKSRQ